MTAGKRTPKPDDVRCQGIYGEKYKKDPSKIGQQCERMLDAGTEYCPRHRPIPPERQCSGRGKPHLAMRGQTVCGIHGGKTAKNLAAGARRVAEAELETKVIKTLARLDVAPIDNPLAALSQLAGQVVAWQNALAERVNGLTALRYEDARGAEQLRSEVVLYERAMDRCNTVLNGISRLNIDERMAAISEKQASKVLEAIDAVLDYLGVTGEQATAAKRVAARKLRPAA